MTDENRAACAAMLDWLEHRHAAVMDCEKRAYQHMEAGDIDAYRANMREKAVNLSAILDDAQKLLAALPADLGASLAARLAAFAGGAKNALGLDSVFYMSALLYPDMRKPGEPDNLALCIDDFRARID